MKTLDILDLAILLSPEKRLQLMAVKVAYFDGCCKSHDKNCHNLVLAGYVGTEDTWKRFAPRWEQFKQQYGINYMHASELNAGKKEYKGYGIYEKAFLRSDFTLLMRDFNKDGLQAVVSIVSLDDYRSIVDRVLPTPESICAEDCLNSLCGILSEDDALQVFYDRGESFFPALRNAWDNDKARMADPRLQRIESFSPVADWRRIPAMQAADCLGYWLMRAQSGGTWVLRDQMLSASLPRWGNCYRKADLLKLETV